MGVLKGDFIGFTFNNSRSSDLGLVRVSDGSRYNENLLPDMSLTTMPVPGGDGTYYWDSFYTQRIFSISVAFDHLEERQIRLIKQIFGEKKIGKLIFDESPYKYYNVKISAAPNFKYICFLENDQRIYKGEGTLQFTAFSPYGISREKTVFKKTKDKTFLTEKDYYKKEESTMVLLTEEEKMDNNILVNSYELNEIFKETDYLEWFAGSHLLLDDDTLFISSDSTAGTKLAVYNGGDIDTDLFIYIPFKNKKSIPIISLFLEDTDLTLTLRDIKVLPSDSGLRINTKAKTVEGYYIDNLGNIELTGTLYNEYITSGDFFQLPKMKQEETMTLNCYPECSKVDYDFLYY